MAAPSAGGVLADMGADVVKVEPLTGDVVRGHVAQGQGRRPTSTTRSTWTTAASGRSPSPSTGPTARRSCASSPTAPTCSCATCCRTARSATGSTRRRCTPANRRLVHATLSGYGLVGPDVDPPGLRRHDVLRPGGDHRRDDRARRRRADAAPGAGRPHDRHRDGRRRSSPACASPSAPARGRSSTSACSPPRRGRWPATWRRRSSTAARSRKRDRHHLITAARQPLPLQRRPLDHPQHARDPLVGAVLQDDRAPRAARGRPLRHGARTASTTCRR